MSVTRMLWNVALSTALAGLLTLGVAAAQHTTPAQSTDSTMSGRNPGTSGQSESSTMSVSDKKFVREAAIGGIAEVEMGELAAEKGSSSQVKQFGQRMVDDHSKANDQLKQIAASKGIDLPTELDARHKAKKEMLSKLSGEQFDHAYMKDMVKDHTEDVAEFKKESTSGKDPDIKNFAAQTLPTLKEHLQQATSIAPKSGTRNSGMGSSSYQP